jgi:hypothetical protein
MNSGQFKKGQAAWNKGLKGVNGESEKRFKKGNKTWNTLPLGAERVDKDGYTYVKVAEKGTATKKWKLKHRLLYAQHYGEITSETIVRFFDNDPSNISIENLYAITRAESAMLNRINFTNEPVELKPTILALVRMCLKTKTVYKVNT